MSPSLIAAARRLEPHVRKLDSIVVPLATGGGRGIETSEEDLRANLRAAVIEMMAASYAEIVPGGFPTNDSLELLVREVMEWHADRTSVNYNECEASPCIWCARAIALLPKDS